MTQSQYPDDAFKDPTPDQEPGDLETFELAKAAGKVPEDFRNPVFAENYRQWLQGLSK